MKDNVIRFSAMGQTPEECLEWLQQKIDAGEKIETCVVGVITPSGSEDLETMSWVGSGTRAHLFWLLSFLLESAKRRWM